MAPPNKSNSLDSDSDSFDVDQYVVRPSSQKPPVVQVSDEEDYSSTDQEREDVEHTHSESDSEQKTYGKKRGVHDNTNRHSSKRSKKKKEAFMADAGGSGEGNNDMQEDVKLPAGRVFSEEEDVIVQDGMLDFMSNTGNDPFKHSKAFHSFMRNSIRAEITTAQLKRKVRGLKEKFEKGKWKYDKKAFEILKKIGWGKKCGNEGENEKGKVASTTLKNVASSSRNVESDIDKLSSAMFSFGDDMGLCTMRMTKEDVKKGLELIGDSKRAELMGKWKHFHIETMKALVDRAVFVNYNVTLILKELQKSTD